MYKLNVATKARIMRDVEQALDNWTDVPEFVEFRFHVTEDKIFVCMYDDALPGEMVGKFEVQVTIKDIR